MITFKQFLTEGGNATAKYNTERVTQDDIRKALVFISSAIKIPVETLKNDLLGSTELTYLGKKQDSGDIDIAVSLKDNSVEDIDAKMLKAVNGEGGYNAGTRVGSYAVPMNGKKIQVDLMFVSNKEWSKFIYHSEQGAGSEYPGAVRNIILMTALAHTQEPGKDFIMRDDEGRPIIRASRSIKMDVGMERLFKMAKINSKTGKYNKSIDKVDPAEIEAHLKTLGKKVKFSHDPEITDNPDHIASFVFGKGVKAKDIMSAENVIKYIKKIKNSEEILKACKSELTRLALPIPKEL